ncbi:unnamed protein product [Lactuca virosa]|uniref:Uncharacterized protein n=1 Tax=Lactuca virosa TaxID=75947 RepID=A0AAU9LF38_9ASTR|nr:unnamed protein product [Lactuca virosa]
MEEDRSSNIPRNLSNNDPNVNIGKTFSLDSSIVQPPPSPPLIILIVHTTIVPFNPPTFAGILQQPINILFSSQSTDDEINIEEDERVEFF